MNNVKYPFHFPTAASAAWAKQNTYCKLARVQLAHAQSLLRKRRSLVSRVCRFLGV